MKRVHFYDTPTAGNKDIFERNREDKLQQKIN